MARELKIEVAALNIKVHPNSPTHYVDLFETAYKLQRSAKIRGHYFGTIGFIQKIGTNPVDGIQGAMYRYTDIDPDEPWINLENRKVLEDEEEKPHIPDHLKPNLKEALFVFYPEVHRLVFDARAITPGSMKTLLEGILNSPDIKRKFGNVEVLIESSAESIKRILKIHRKTKLEIRISLPNADEGSDPEKRILEKMGAQNAEKLEYMLTSKDPEGLQPDDDTVVLMKTAKSNGVVYVTGRDEYGVKVEESTKNHPLKKVDRYDPQQMSLLEGIKRISHDVLKAIFD